VFWCPGPGTRPREFDGGRALLTSLPLEVLLMRGVRPSA